MNSQIVKRNYLYFVLQMLKEKTAEDGEHLSAEDITALMKKEYGLEPNRKTIYTVISDLQELGFDVHLQKGGDEPGYYLGKRELSEAELNLLIDGIESLDNLTSDEKTDIYEKLCKIIGYPSKKIDNYLYAGFNQSNDFLGDGESTMEKLEVINKAIRLKKQVRLPLFSDPDVLTAYLIKRLSAETAKTIWENKDKFAPALSPYKLFRNKNNEICLLFVATLKGSHYPGFIPVTTIGEVEMLSKTRAKIDETALFPEDLSKYETARDYLEDQEVVEAPLFLALRGASARLCLLSDLKRVCESVEETTYDEEPALVIQYRIGKESLIADLILEYLPNVFPAEGSHLYERFAALNKGLSMVLVPKKQRRKEAAPTQGFQIELNENTRPNIEASFEYIYSKKPQKPGQVERFVATINYDLEYDEIAALAYEFKLGKAPKPTKESSLKLAIQKLRHPTRVRYIMGPTDPLQ